MNAYIDASVFLREILDQKPRLREWHELVVGVSSELARVECLRTIDRLRVLGRMSDEEVASTRETIDAVFGRIDLLPVDSAVLARASEPLPTSLTTLDSIHLATARMYRDNQTEDAAQIWFATFDLALSTAARATGFRVIGI